jgi:hypothetical protein
MRLVAQLGDLQIWGHVLPLASIHNGLLQGLSQTRADDVVDLAPFEKGHYGLVVEPTVSAKQAHCRFS